MKIINLLPKEKQQELGYNRLLRVLVFVIWLTIASFVLVLFAQFGVKAYLASQKSLVENNIKDLKQQTGKEENAKIKAQIDTLNSVIEDYQSLSAGVPKLSKVVREFAPLVPAGVTVNSMRMDAEKKTVEITGLSPTRELVIELYDNIVADAKNFPGIDYPLENVARPTDIAFHFTFNINPELLK